MTLLFGILNQNKAEEQLRYQVTPGITYGGTAPVVTAREADEMRIEEIRRVLNRNNLPTTPEANPEGEWDRAFHSIRRWEIAYEANGMRAAADAMRVVAEEDLRRTEQLVAIRTLDARLDELRNRSRPIVDDIQAVADYAEPEADQANGG